MFVHENSGLILKTKLSRKKKSNFSNFQNGNCSNSAKAAFQSTHIFMHAVHFILNTIFTSLQKHCIQIEAFICVHTKPSH